MTVPIEISHTQFPLAGVSRPALGHVDLWLTDLSKWSLTKASSDAKEDARSDHKQLVRDRRIHTQFFLRLLLGRYLDIPGKDLSFQKTPRGKPFIEDAPISFNLSHSREWLVVAVSAPSDLGVDLEVLRKITRAQDLSARYFSPEETNVLSHLAEAEKSKQFLTRWTASEALVKANGSSIAQALSGLVLDAEAKQLLACPTGWSPKENWHFQHFEVGDDMPFGAHPRTPLLGCVALSRPLLGLHLRTVAPPLPI